MDAPITKSYPKRAMLALSSPLEPVHLHFAEGKVLITPDDAKRFRIAVSRAVNALQREEDVDEYRMRFQDEYLPRLHSWCLANHEAVRGCYLGLPTPHGLTVFVVGRSKRFDFVLGSKISEFALELEDDGWSSNIIQITHGEPEELMTYFDPESSLEVYAQSEATPGEGGA